MAFLAGALGGSAAGAGAAGAATAGTAAAGSGAAAAGAASAGAAGAAGAGASAGAAGAAAGSMASSAAAGSSAAAPVAAGAAAKPALTGWQKIAQEVTGVDMQNATAMRDAFKKGNYGEGIARLGKFGGEAYKLTGADRRQPLPIPTLPQDTTQPFSNAAYMSRYYRR